jgi:hypothetical protein
MNRSLVMIESRLFKPYIIGPTTILAMIAGVVVAILSSSGGQHDVGGREPPPAAAVEKLKKMPRHPTEVGINEPVAVGRAAERQSAARGNGANIVAFYAAQLQTQGWQAEGPMTVENSDRHLDGTVAKMHTQTFLTDDSKVTVTAVESQKDTKQGDVRLSLLVEPY